MSESVPSAVETGENNALALPLLVPDHPRESEVEDLRRWLLPLVPTAASVSGTDAALFRLLTRAVFAPESDLDVAVRNVRLAAYAVEQAPPDVRDPLFAWPHSRCCPQGAIDVRQTQSPTSSLSSCPGRRSPLDAPPETDEGDAGRANRRSLPDPITVTRPLLHGQGRVNAYRPVVAESVGGNHRQVTFCEVLVALGCLDFEQRWKDSVASRSVRTPRH